MRTRFGKYEVLAIGKMRKGTYFYQFAIQISKIEVTLKNGEVQYIHDLLCITHKKTSILNKGISTCQNH
jgi:hypothetical protein